MRSAQASLTAKAVATMRVIASKTSAAAVRLDDHASMGLLSSPLRGIVRTSVLLAGLSEPLFRACLYLAGHLVDHVALRTRLIDRLVEDAVAQGAGQLVLLGAGLDARAYRIRALEAVDVFEIDHPATQQYKRARTQHVMPVSRSLTHVAVDFERDSLAQKMAACGFQSNVMSCFVCEGVYPYLSHASVERSLRDIATLATDKSRLVVTYLPRSARFQPHIRMAAPVVLRLLGEPFGEDWLPEEFATAAQAAGFSVLNDYAAPHWLAALGVAPRGTLYEYERLAVLERNQL